MIPGTIIQTWRTASLPDRAAPLCESWRRLNPGMRHLFFDDEACRRLVAETVPQFLDAWLALPHAVMRADFFRYAALYRHGGIYADIDMECVRPVANLLALAPVVLGVEARLTVRRQRELGYARPAQIANCMMLAEPGQPFFMEAMARCVGLAAEEPETARGRIEDVTGPRMLTRLFYERPRPGIAVLRQMVLTPPRHYPDLWPFNARVHARHHFFGTWKAAARRPLSRVWIERDRWPNPFGADLLDPELSALPGAGSRA
jgi:mannosyltransferase OCH1-like enzyme